MTDQVEVVDVFTSFPTAERIALEIRSWGTEAGYSELFAQRWADVLDLPVERVTRVQRLAARDFLVEARKILADRLPTEEETVTRLRRAGIVRAVLHGPLIVDVPVSNDATVELAELDRDLLVPFARIDPTAGAQAAAEVRRCAALGVQGITLTPFWHGVSCDDPAVAPVLEAAQDCGLVAWIHTSMNWKRSAPLDLEHPRHLDAIAGRYPALDIVAGHGGWPWVLELVSVAWRHRNVFIDLSAFHPRNVFRAGSGWEALVYYGERTVADRLLFGTTWTLLGVTPEEAVRAASEVPWPHQVKERWLCANGRALLDRRT